jgi:hypothetical protein
VAELLLSVARKADACALDVGVLKLGSVLSLLVNWPGGHSRFGALVIGATKFKFQPMLKR